MLRVAQATENQHLKERMQQAELLLRVHGVDTDLLVKEGLHPTHGAATHQRLFFLRPRNSVGDD